MCKCKSLRVCFSWSKKWRTWQRSLRIFIINWSVLIHTLAFLYLICNSDKLMNFTRICAVDNFTRALCSEQMNSTTVVCVAGHGQCYFMFDVVSITVVSVWCSYCSCQGHNGRSCFRWTVGFHVVFVASSDIVQCCLMRWVVVSGGQWWVSEWVEAETGHQWVWPQTRDVSTEWKHDDSTIWLHVTTNTSNRTHWTGTTVWGSETRYSIK